MRTGLMGDIIRSIEFRDATGCEVFAVERHRKLEERLFWTRRVVNPDKVCVLRDWNNLLFVDRLLK
jgi:hypothetical protein